MAEALAAKIAPRRVRYIKLGDGGRWEKTCLERSLLYIGFGTHEPERFRLCASGRWDDLERSLLAENPNKGRATNVKHQLEIFFEDDGTILWITFHAGRLYWASVDGSVPEPSAEMGGSVRRMRDGWRDRDLRGEPLAMDRLSGRLTKLAAYRGTSCDVDDADYAVHRINGEKVEAVENALGAVGALEEAAIPLMRLLTPKDFELLVDLVFSTSGWRRVGIVGGTTEALDIDLVLPTTGERAFVQVKSQTDSKQLADYVERLGDRGELYTPHVLRVPLGDPVAPGGRAARQSRRPDRARQDGRRRGPGALADRQDVVGDGVGGGGI